MVGAKHSLRQRTATIIGGSIGGLATGLALLQRDWDVHIFEASRDELESRGAGIITHPVLLDSLSVLGISNTKDIGVQIEMRKTFGKDGQIIAALPMEQIATSWGRIYQLLKQQFPSERYHTNTGLLYHQQLDDEVVAYFSNGTNVSSELLIAADGIRSTLRQKLEPSSIPQYVGYMAWRGLIDEKDLDESERHELLPFFTFCLPEGEQVLSYPVAGESHNVEEGHRRMNVVWYRPAEPETTLQDMLTDVDGNNNGVSIAPDKIRPSVIGQMQADAKILLSPQHAQLMCKVKQAFIQPIYDLTTRSMAHRNIAIVGDAAFTARPHVAVGITKAIEDALVLAEELDKYADIAASLSSFNDNRLPANHAWIDRSRQLGAYLQTRLFSAAECHYAQQHRTKDAVMRETANLDW